MFNVKKSAVVVLSFAAAAVPCSGWDFFRPDECIFRDCRYVMMPPPRGETRFAYSEETVSENRDGFVIRLVTPGVPKEAYAVGVKNDILRVSVRKKGCAGKKDDKKAGTDTKAVPDFVRAYKLPPNVDRTKIKAVYKDGVMTISIPKVKEPEKPEIKITVE